MMELIFSPQRRGGADFLYRLVAIFFHCGSTKALRFHFSSICASASLLLIPFQLFQTQ